MEFQLARSFDLVVNDGMNCEGRRGLIQLRTPEEALYCLRVWYLFYICDHHLSILYGRPSTFGKQKSVDDWERYLDVVPEDSTDVRLASQIHLLLILDKVTDLFNLTVDASMPIDFYIQLEKFNDRIDQWIIRWRDRYGEL